MSANFKIYYKKLNTWYSPESLFTYLFKNNEYACWLDSSKTIDNNSYYSYIGSGGPLCKKIRYDLNKKVLLVSKGNEEEKIRMSIFQYLDGELDKWEGIKSKLPFDFTGGFIGYFGYELYKETLPVKLSTRNLTTRNKLPDAFFLFIDQFVAFDHKEKKVYLVCISEIAEKANVWFGKICKKISEIPKQTKNKLNSAESSSKTLNKINYALDRNHEQYLKNIRACMRYLRKGECYQICLTNKITAKLKLDWLDLYLTLRSLNPAPYSAYIRFGDFAILSTSPELLISIDTERNITSKPIKGTVKRGKSREEDKKLAEKLGKTEKDFAENIMIVDLVRNDLSRVCEIGSVKAPELLAVETYATMHQLVSTITGKLDKDASTIDAVKSVFPGGSMTGAPKLRAVEILERLERSPRGIYSGALGYLSVSGALKLSIIIRTIIANNDSLSIGVGGAILLQSDPEAEYMEMLLKAKVLLEAIKKGKGLKN